MNKIKKVLAIREGGQTQRCHTMLYHGAYNVAIHSYNAVSLLLQLYPTAPSIALIRAVMWHDVPERWTGDVPTPAKMACPELRVVLDGLEKRILTSLGIGELFTSLSGHERNWLNAVDLLELYIWACEQVAIGNTTAKDMVKQILQIFEERKDNTPLEVQHFVDNFIYTKSVECHNLI